MKKYFFLILCVLLSSSMFASGLEGHIYNEAGEPLIGATIFVQSTGQGAVTNADGYYLILLPSGEQTVVFQFLGYEAISKNIKIPSDKRLKLDITLREQTYSLPTLEIKGSDKELANAIMRKAIAKADYHRQQVDKYTTTVYIKGAGRLKKSPRLLRKIIEKEGVDSTRAFTSESVSEITYERPYKYHQKVISIYEKGESNGTSPARFIEASFYNNKVAGDMVSPLAKNAFAYYKFNLEGYFLDRNYGVNKIKVTPRSRGEKVFEGYIYILEDYWSIHSLDLTTYLSGIKININQIFQVVDKEIWMPVTQKYTIDGKFFGFGFEYIYNAISNDYKIEINPDLDASFDVVDNKGELITLTPQAKVDKESSTLDQLNTNKELTRKDLRKIMRKYEKEERKARKEKKDIVYEESIEIDSLAGKKDSTYWERIRPIPLTKYEEKGYRISDSLAVVDKKKKEKEALTGKKDKPKKSIGFFDFLTGTYAKIGKHSAFFTKGIHKGFSFDPVEGYSLRETFSFSHLANNRRKILSVTPRYAFARKELFVKGGLELKVKKANKTANNVHLEGGNYIFQYNEEGAILPILNAWENLISERNYIRLFQKKYAKATYHINSEKWDFSTSFEWANRSILHNITTQTFWNRENRDYASNIPINNEAILPTQGQQKAAIFTLSVEGQPWLKYFIKNGKKHMIEGSSPTIGVRYKKGINGFLDSEVNYDFAEVWAKKTFDVRAGTSLWLNVNAGMFFNNKSLGFMDFKHFEGNRLLITDLDPVNSFRLLDYYQYSTKDKYLTIKTQYQFRKFLVSQIPDVWLLGIKENVFVNSLMTPGGNNYWEVGYGIENIFHLFRVEFVASFDGAKYKEWGVLIGVSSVFSSDGNSVTVGL